MNKFWTKIFLFGTALLLLLFFSNDFGIVNIQKTAIVVAIGMDVSENEDKFDVTAQIAMPASAAGGGAEVSSNVTIQGAETVGEAIAELNRKTGWYPTLVHCRLLVLGEGTDQQDVFRFTDYFLRSEYVEDTCLIAMCEGRAEELMRAKSSVGDMTSTAVAKVLSPESQKTGTVCVTNLRDFAKGYYSVSKSGFLPVLAAMPEAENGSSGSSGSSQPASSRTSRDDLPVQGSGQSAGQGSSSGSEGKNKSDVFDATKTALFFEGRRVALLDAEQTLAFNLADSSTDIAYGNVTVAENGKEVTYNLKIKIEKKEQRLRVEDGLPVFTFRIAANAQIADVNKPDSAVNIAKTTIVPEHVLRAAEEKFTQKLAETVALAGGNGCDLFGMKIRLFRFAHQYYDEWKDSVLQQARIVYDIRVNTLK